MRPYQDRGNVRWLPIIPRRSFNDPAWREQHNREIVAQIRNDISPPPRTRPLVVLQRAENSKEG